MSDLRPVRVFSLKVPPGGEIVDANPGVPASIRVTMAAIDPKEGAEAARATLRIVHDVLGFQSYEDEDDEDDEDDEYDSDDVEAIERRVGLVESDEDMTDDDSEEDNEIKAVNGGRVQELALALAKQASEDDAANEGTNGINGTNGHKPFTVGDIAQGMEDHIVCTLDRNATYQVPLELTIRENEECYFRNTGSVPIYLTGNFVVSSEELDDDSEYDSEDEEDGLDDLVEPLGHEEDYSDESEEDALDGLDDLQAAKTDEAPQLITKSTKSKNKRIAEETDETKTAEKAVNGQQEHQPKKLKKNDGHAVGKDAEKTKKKLTGTNNDESPSANGHGKKVKFAEKLEQGPTSTAAPRIKGAHNVSGVTVEDKKLGTGPGAKNGDKVGMRYIGKLKDGKVFDSNKKGKPFTFKMGVGEVIKGWDIGLQGMAIGGERRIVIPSSLAYGSKVLPGIPAKSDLIFDLKLISIN